MKDIKYYPIMAISLILLLASFTLICIMGYNIYKNNRFQSDAVPANLDNKFTIIEPAIQDLLKKSNGTIIDSSKINDRYDSSRGKTGKLNANFNESIDSFYMLKNEITNIIKPSNDFSINIAIVNQKMDALQQKVQELKNANIEIEQENTKLKLLIDKSNQVNNIPSQQNQQQSFLNKTPTSTAVQTVAEPVFSVATLSFTAKNSNAVQSNHAEEIKNFIGTLNIKSTTNSNNVELIIVIVEPNGQVLHNSWEELGNFDTNKGKKEYSHKIYFDCTKAENKTLTFSLDADKCQKGTYTMFVYYKGKLVGQTSKRFL